VTVLHIVTHAIFPVAGGLEAALLRIARGLSQSPGFKVVVYIQRSSSEYMLDDPAHFPLEVVHLARQKSFLMEPLQASPNEPSENVPNPSSYARESFRIDYLLLVAAVKARIDHDPDARHLIISFFATNSGFVAQQVSLTLGVPHMASIRGSDFSRDFRSPRHCEAIRFAVENARLVVTTNHEQARTLAAAFPSSGPFRTIHNAVENVPSEMWTPSPSDVVRLVADCEFTFKKGTHILLRAVGELLSEGQPVSLTLAGRVEPTQRSYWDESKRQYAARFPGAFSFHDWMPAERVTAMILSSHVYTSATLGEGCSNGLARAMTLGIPIVTTRCGALPDAGGSASHVRMCAPSDLDAFVAELRSMVANIRGGKLAVDQDQIREWRQYFATERERTEWRQAVNEALELRNLARPATLRGISGVCDPSPAESMPRTSSEGSKPLPVAMLNFPGPDR